MATRHVARRLRPTYLEPFDPRTSSQRALTIRDFAQHIIDTETVTCSERVRQPAAGMIHSLAPPLNRGRGIFKSYFIRISLSSFMPSEAPFWICFTRLPTLTGFGSIR